MRAFRSWGYPGCRTASPAAARQGRRRPPPLDVRRGASTFFGDSTLDLRMARRTAVRGTRFAPPMKKTASEAVLVTVRARVGTRARRAGPSGGLDVRSLL